MADGGKQIDRWNHPGDPTRRRFLARTAGWAAAGALSQWSAGRARADGRVTSDPPKAVVRAAVPEAPVRVVRIVAPRIIPSRVVQSSPLRSALVDGLRHLEGTRDAGEALHRLFKTDDLILFKFNRAGAESIGTSEPMARELARLMNDAGWAPERLMFLEAGPLTGELRRTRPPDLRWQGRQARFGRCGSDVFRAALDEATAIVNVPFLKTHHLATMTGCLKNLSHGLVRHPARFHAGGCDPAIGEINAHEAIRSRIKLNVVNALRVVYRGGSEASERNMADAGAILLGRDPVACDLTGFELLNEVRASKGEAGLLPARERPKQLMTAERLGVGRLDGEEIELVSPE